jgi:hypothetical protein
MIEKGFEIVERSRAMPLRKPRPFVAVLPEDRNDVDTCNRGRGPRMRIADVPGPEDPKLHGFEIEVTTLSVAATNELA